MTPDVREIALDTETTGLSPENGDRIIEIGCVEMINHLPTGRTYQAYINPEMEVSSDTIRITGYTNEFLRDKPVFAEIVDDFLNFVNGSTLVIHNAQFDIAFLNSELKRLGKPLFNLNEAVDTLFLAKKKLPGSAVNLDALCKRFNVDNSARDKHGALLDSQLLSEVYINLLEEKQRGLSFGDAKSNEVIVHRHQHAARKFPPSEDELNAHKEFLEKLSSPLWNQE